MVQNTYGGMFMNCLRFYSREQQGLVNCFRKLWEQHVMWTRSFIISTAHCLPDLAPVTARLLRNPEDFACVFRKYYGQNCAEVFCRLLTEHLKIGGDLVTAVKNNETEKVPLLRDAWYENAGEIAEFLCRINPFWSECKWRELLNSHLEMTEKEAALRIGGRFAEDIAIYGEIENEALVMADYMAMGFIRHFCV